MHRILKLELEQTNSDCALCNVLTKSQLECGPTPNVMVDLPNIGGALCSTPQSLTGALYYMPCSNAAKTQNPLKFVGVPQTPQTDLSR